MTGDFEELRIFRATPKKKVFSTTKSEFNPNFSFREKLAITQKAQVKKK